MRIIEKTQKGTNKAHFSQWLGKINTSSLKIKIIVSLVSISGVHLLKTFIDIHNVLLQDAVVQISIHLVFLLSALLLAYSDKIMASLKSH